ncbi:hypothetical protein, partial [Klebsiella pneumoniae]|uniref:hypothetical protein n=1 Tax=Klebsiella pneumoniae TaxID=573 RepID=UPI00272F8321
MNWSLIEFYAGQAKNTGTGFHFLLQGIFLTQGSNQHLLHWQLGSLLLCHMESLAIKSTLAFVLFSH